MGLSPEYLSNLSQDLIDNYTNMETELLMNISKKLSKGNNLLIDNKIVDWEFEMLAQIDGLTEDNIKIISKTAKKAPEEIKDILFQASKTLNESSESIMKQGALKGALNTAIPIDDSLTIGNMLLTASNGTLTTFNQVNNTMLSNAGKEYVKVINNVSTQVQAGTKSATKALSESVKILSNKGITSFQSVNGAQWTTEAYTRMIIVTNSKNTAYAIQVQRFRDYGNNYVIINSYSGARPKCSEDQGKVYSLDGSTQPIKDLDGKTVSVQAWSNTTFGQADGILGINCGHTRSAFVPDLSTNDNKKIDKKENTKEYKQRQTQRGLERNIRTSKRELEMLKTIKAPKDAISAAQSSVSADQKTMRKFIDQTGSTRISYREQIFISTK